MLNGSTRLSQVVREGAVGYCKRTPTANRASLIDSASAFGGGIHNYTYFSLTIVNSTFSNNSAMKSGAGIYNYNWSTLNYVNTIVANSSSGGDCVNLGALGLNTDNLVEDGSCAASLSGDPKLDPLTNNGGSTQTMALLPGSLAINAGDDTNCPATDQRGIVRPQRGHCDIGEIGRASCRERV